MKDDFTRFGLGGKALFCRNWEVLVSGNLDRYLSLFYLANITVKLARLSKGTWSQGWNVKRCSDESVIAN